MLPAKTNARCLTGVNQRATKRGSHAALENRRVSLMLPDGWFFSA